MQLSRRVAVATFAKPQVISPGWLRRAFLRASCTLWGHHVDNRVFRTAATESRHCRCGAAYLGEDRSVTRVRHTLKCFLRHHTYRRLIDRDGYHEYVCIVCGHPLLFREDQDPYDRKPQFEKKVRYLCGLFGHRVEHVTSRDGFIGYACHCGHTFLKAENAHFDQASGNLRHQGPLRAVRRPPKRFAEYVCRTVGILSVSRTRSSPIVRKAPNELRTTAVMRWRLAALLAADVFFLWMFLAAAPLEQMAEAGRLIPDDHQLGTAPTPSRPAGGTACPETRRFICPGFLRSPSPSGSGCGQPA